MLKRSSVNGLSMSSVTISIKASMVYISRCCLTEQPTDIPTAEDFVSSLLSFPADAELITESVHSASSTLDSRHFAEEFLRRRKLADKGIVDDRNTSSPAENKAAGSGWSEVAKKGGASTTQQQQQQPLDSSNFKVVAAKKKAKR
jgi:PERQ amino acid-rich with GYF domain-containing protein